MGMISSFIGDWFVRAVREGSPEARGMSLDRSGKRKATESKF
jgi:hypothetical protein